MIFLRLFCLSWLALSVSCTIPVAGKVELKSHAPSVLVGRTSVAELSSKLGKPKLDVVITGNRYVRWDWARVKIAPTAGLPIGGALTDPNAGIFQWLSVEAGPNDIVKRKLFHEYHQAMRQTLVKTQMGTPYEIMENAELYRHAKSSGELVRVLGNPLSKELSPHGEKWVWVAVERGFVNRNLMVTAMIDRGGNALEIRRKKG